MDTHQELPAARATGRTLQAAAEEARPCNTSTLDFGLQMVRRQTSVVPNHLACRTLPRWPQDLTGQRRSWERWVLAETSGVEQML